MNESDLNRTEKRFDALVAMMAYANPDIKEALSIYTAYSSSTNIKPRPYRGFYFFKTSHVNQLENIIFPAGIQEDQDPVTQEDLVNNRENEIQELVYQIRSAVYIPNRTQIANRLLDLYICSKEENPDGIGINVESLRNFCVFLRNNIDLKTPAISLSPDNNIYASWRGYEGRVFSAHFLSNKEVRFVIFRPNEWHPGRKIRISGSTTYDILMKTVASHHLQNWISK